MGRSLGLEICWKMEIKVDETYHVASCCCPQYAHKISRKIVLFIFPTTLCRKDEADYFSRNFVCILRTTTIRHMVSFVDFYFHFLANFQT